MLNDDYGFIQMEITVETSCKELSSSLKTFRGQLAHNFRRCEAIFTTGVYLQYFGSNFSSLLPT